jgi:hypothetical protein
MTDPRNRLPLARNSALLWTKLCRECLTSQFSLETNFTNNYFIICKKYLKWHKNCRDSLFFKLKSRYHNFIHKIWFIQSPCLFFHERVILKIWKLNFLKPTKLSHTFILVMSKLGRPHDNMLHYVVRGINIMTKAADSSHNDDHLQIDFHFLITLQYYLWCSQRKA